MFDTQLSVGYPLLLLYCLCLLIDASFHHSAAGYRRFITIDLSYQAESKPVRPLGMLITQVVLFPAQTHRQTGAGAAS